MKFYSRNLALRIPDIICRMLYVIVRKQIPWKYTYMPRNLEKVSARQGVASTKSSPLTLSFRKTVERNGMKRKLAFGIMSQT